MASNDTEPIKRGEQEKGPERKPVIFEVEGQKIEGLVMKPDGPPLFNMLILSGGGNLPHQQTYAAWQERLAMAGVGNMSFDFRGVGASEGELSQTSLDTRLEDARAAIEVLKRESPSRKIYITGASMGAPVAIQLANEIGADGLVLIAPAAYSEEARHQQFGPAFTEAISKESSWDGSPDFSEFEQFDGKVLVTYGEQDDVIPSSILQQYADIARNKGEVLVLPNVGHRFMRENDPVSVIAREEVQTSLEILAA